MGPFPIFVGLLAAFLQFSNGQQLLPREEDCPFGTYGEHNQKCICLHQGLWGLMTEYCTEPLGLFGVYRNKTFCVANEFSGKIHQLHKLLTFEVPEVAQLSSTLSKLVDRFDNYSTNVPFNEDIFRGKSTLISYGAPEWTLTADDGSSYCLLHESSPTSHYCLFQSLRAEGKWLRVKQVTVGCKTELNPMIHSTNCFPIEGDRSCPEALRAPELIPPQPKAVMDARDDPLSPANLLNVYKFLTSNPNDLKNNALSKRDGKNKKKEAAAAETKTEKDPKKNSTSTGNGLLDEDEDSVKFGLDEIGHKLMREQIDQYVDSVIATLTGLNDASNIQTPKSRYPVLKILNLVRLIMQKTCAAVKSEYFELALNSFLKVQLESFHVKEPYISHSVFVRIDYALKSCYNNAKSHVFHSNSTCPKVNGTTQEPGDETSLELDVHGDGKEIVKLEETPPYAKGTLDAAKVREPLTETVWKMLINAHSYCYPYFKAYFNDHHALTVSLLPLFNNAIQDIWLKEGGYDLSKGKLYGGMLGDTKKVLEDVDHCVAASRHVSNYPWYMSRPMRDLGNKWKKRKRRELPIDVSHIAPTPVYLNKGNTLCLFDPDDPVAFLGKPTCSAT